MLAFETFRKNGRKRKKVMRPKELFWLHNEDKTKKHRKFPEKSIPI
jgi:hypothetical protein